MKAAKMFREHARAGSQRFLVIFVPDKLDRPNVDLQKAAKKVIDAGGRIIAFKMGDHVKDGILKNVLPNGDIISAQYTDDWWRLALMFDYLIRKSK